MSLTLIIFGVLLGGWAFLSVLGNERQRLVQDRDAANAAAAAARSAADGAAAKSEASVGR